MNLFAQFFDNDFCRLFLKESPARLERLVLVSLLTGLVNGLLMFVIISAAQHACPGALNIRYFAMFLIAMTSLVLCRRYSVARSAEVSEEIANRLRERLVDKLRNAQFALFERIGRSPIYTTLSKDTLAISQAGAQLANSFSALILLTASGAFVAYISVKAFFLLTAAIGIAASTCLATSAAVRTDMNQSIEQEKILYDLLNHFLDGFKEVRINRARSEDLYENYFRPASREAKRLKLKTARKFADLGLLISCCFFGVIAATIFIMPTLTNITTSAVIQICTIILFVMGPLGEVLSIVPTIVQANVSAKNLLQIERDLDDAVHGQIEVATSVLKRPLAFQTIAARDLTFSYGPVDGGQPFTLGPINLEIKRGEILFIVGGNGSGKSTFMKLLTGLYQPDGGGLYLDDRKVENHYYPRYRDLMATIFTDFHLFDRLYGMPDVTPAEIDRVLEMLGLASRITVTEGRFNTLNLSTGLRKRLGLLVCYLENKSVLFFDEVAADQDPGFRKYFYEELLPQFRSEGKTIIAATHDDAYFHCANRVFRMEYGKLSPYFPPDGMPPRKA